MDCRADLTNRSLAVKDILEVTSAPNNRGVGKRSRLVSRRRKSRDNLQALTRIWAERCRVTLNLCRVAAELADRRGTASAIELLCRDGRISAEDAADYIAIGQRLLERRP